MSNQLVISIITDDRPGVVELVADILAKHQGNWLESALSRLGGKFAGILLAEVPAAQQTALETDLAALEAKGIHVSVNPAGAASPQGERIRFEVVGNDRRGIVGEISQMLARHNVSVDELYTHTESAPMSGELLFRANATVVLPPRMHGENLRQLLEQLSDDLMVEYANA